MSSIRSASSRTRTDKRSEAHGLLAAEIEQAPGSGDEDIDPSREGINLPLLADAAKDRGAAQLQMPSVGAEAVFDLYRQLTRRREHEGARVAAGAVYPLREALQDG